jgi:hypothetical protein
MLEYFPRVLKIRRKNEEYAEVTFISNYALRLGVVGYKLVIKSEQFTNIIFGLSFNNFVLCV